jgi:hypothetical protein
MPRLLGSISRRGWTGSSPGECSMLSYFSFHSLVVSDHFLHRVSRPEDLSSSSLSLSQSCRPSKNICKTAPSPATLLLTALRRMGDAPPSYENAFHYPTLPPQQQSQLSAPLHVHSNSSTVNPTRGANQRTGPITRPKMGEVKLYQDNNERRRHEELCDLYAIIKVTESLEAAYSRDAITSSEYAESCTKLISQFKSTESALITGGMITGADVFMREFNIDCPRAFDRLIRAGVPATVLQMTHDDRADSVIVAETVQVRLRATTSFSPFLIACRLSSPPWTP